MNNRHDTLDEKLAARAGRLQLLIAALASLAREYESAEGYAIIDSPGVDELLALLGAYGSTWLDECADLIKEQYNRRSDSCTI